MSCLLGDVTNGVFPHRNTGLFLFLSDLSVLILNITCILIFPASFDTW